MVQLHCPKGQEKEDMKMMKVEYVDPCAGGTWELTEEQWEEWFSSDEDDSWDDETELAWQDFEELMRGE